jgi:two-component system, chemotaxis family, response regulator WspF
VRIGIINGRPQAADAWGLVVASRSPHQVIWTARTFAEGVEQCASQMPDLVLMDLPTVGREGVQATSQIMSYAPYAILIVTDSVRTNAGFLFEAMSGRRTQGRTDAGPGDAAGRPAQGPVDIVDMPLLASTWSDECAAALLAKIETMSKLLGNKPTRSSAVAPVILASPNRQYDPLLVIGASAGGPSAVAAVLRGIPKAWSAGVIIVQHLDEGFVDAMAEWLSDYAGQPVSVAREGERPIAGRVLIAATIGHLALNPGGRLGYTQEPILCAYRPSIDVLFHSVSRSWPGHVVGVLLTGMGKDGALGLKALRDKGHHTIAQDEASSGVYGMPKAAAALHAAVDILPLESIAPRLVDVIAGKASRLAG